jgi:hypothetical protein
MSELVKTTYVELQFRTLYSLDPDRPLYYGQVIRTARDIFIYLNKNELLAELELKIKKFERKFKTSFKNFEQAYYTQRFYFNKKAWCRIGDSVDYRKVTRYEMFYELELIKDWIYDSISVMSQRVRLSALTDIKR